MKLFGIGGTSGIKRRLAILVVVFAFVGCHEEEISKDVNCVSGCTSIRGSVLTTNGVPLTNVSVKFKSFTGNMFLSHSRTIKDTRTDQEGLFAIDTYLQDKELSEDHSLGLNVDLRHLDADEFLFPSYFDGYIGTGGSLGRRMRRDTVMQATLYIPKKEYITIHLKNFKPVVENDAFKIEAFSPWGWKSATQTVKLIGNGFLNTAYEVLHTGMDDSFMAKRENETFRNIPMARNETNYIRIIKLKNGVASVEEFKLFVPENNDIELSYGY